MNPDKKDHAIPKKSPAKPRGKQTTAEETKRGQPKTSVDPRTEPLEKR